MSTMSEPQAQARPTILVADDNEALRRMTREALEEFGYRVIEASTGKQAGEQLRQEKIDLLMTDLIMPDSEGIETIADAKPNFPSLRILAISGSSQDYLDGAAMLGADGTLRKPFKLEDLRSAVARLLTAV